MTESETITRWEVVRQCLVRMRDDRKADPGEIREYMANQGLNALESLQRDHQALKRSHECCWHDGHGHGALGPCAETERQDRADAEADKDMLRLAGETWDD